MTPTEHKPELPAEVREAMERLTWFLHEAEANEARLLDQQKFAKDLRTVLAALAEAQQDTKRLDWLQSHQHWILAAEAGEGFSAGSNDNFQNWAQKVESVRAAIDAARAKEDTRHA